MRNLKINSLPEDYEDWVDRDVVMLHACFQIMVDCIEDEFVDIDGDYEANKEFVDEIRFLHKWWDERKDKREDEKQQKGDDEMLMRLLKIRTKLWT